MTIINVMNTPSTRQISTQESHIMLHCNVVVAAERNNDQVIT